MCRVIKYTNLYTAELFCLGQEKLLFSARITVPVFWRKIVKRDARLFTDLDVRTGLPVCETDLTTLLRKAHVTVLRLGHDQCPVQGRMILDSLPAPLQPQHGV
jgi:hypothetical protein